MDNKSIKELRKYINETLLEVLRVLLKQEKKAEKKICRPKMKAKKRLRLVTRLKLLDTSFTNLHALKEFVKTTDDWEILSYLGKLNHWDAEQIGLKLAEPLLKSHEAISASVIGILHDTNFFLGDTKAPKDTLNLKLLERKKKEEGEEEEEEDVEENPFLEEAMLITAGGETIMDDGHGNSIAAPAIIPEEDEENG